MTSRSEQVHGGIRRRCEAVAPSGIPDPAIDAPAAEVE